jgi:hypothetical protein
MPASRDKMDNETVVVGKNRRWGWWALGMIALGLPVSALFLYLGIRPGLPGVSWALVVFGLLGLLAFAAYGRIIIRTLRSPWRLELTPGHLGLYTPAYDLSVPWVRVVGIAVDEVDRRLGCVLAFDDAAAVAAGAVFHGETVQGAVTNAGRMRVRMEENFRQRGYHLGIPGRILELGPDALAAMLARARTGELWILGRESSPALRGESLPDQEMTP